MARLYTLASISIALSCLLQWTPVQGLAVMSVDLGSEWMKIGIVSVSYTASCGRTNLNHFSFSQEFPWTLS